MGEDVEYNAISLGGADKWWRGVGAQKQYTLRLGGLLYQNIYQETQWQEIGPATLAAVKTSSAKHRHCQTKRYSENNMGMRNEAPAAAGNLRVSARNVGEPKA